MKWQQLRAIFIKVPTDLLEPSAARTTHQIIWTGGDFSTTDVGTVDTTCNNWRSESGLGNGGNYGFTWAPGPGI